MAYVALFFPMALFVSFMRARKSGLAFIFFSLFVMLMALFSSPEISRDGGTYVEYYYKVIAGYKLSVEYSFKVLSLVSYTFFNSYTGLFFIYAFFGVLLKLYSFWKLSVLPLHALFIYFCYFFFLHDLTQIRVGVAAGFIFVAFIYYFDRRYFQYFTFVALGLFFHYSAVVFMLVPFFISKNNGLLISLLYLILSLLFVFLYYLGFDVLAIMSVIAQFDPTGKLNYYILALQGGKFQEISFIPRMAPYIAMVLPLLFVYKHLSRVDERFGTFLQLVSLGLFVFSFFASIPVLAYRLSDLFLMFSPLLFSFMPFVFNKKIIGNLLVVSYGLVSFYYLIYVINFVTPYKLIF